MRLRRAMLFSSMPLALSSACVLLAPSDDDLVGVRPDGGQTNNNLYTIEVLKDQPIAYYRFDEPAGSPQAIDDFGNDPAVRSAQGVTFGKPGLANGSPGSIELDGTGYLHVGALFYFHETQPFSIEIWARLDGMGGTTRNLVSSQDPTGKPSGYMLFHLDANLEFERSDNSNAIEGAYTVGTLKIGAVTHIVAVYSGTTITLYQDGVNMDEAPALLSFFAPHNEFRIGGRASENGANLFHGALDELAIYDKALSPARVLAHYNAGKP